MPCSYVQHEGENMSLDVSADRHCRVTIISVSYNSMAVLPAMLASLPVGTPTVIVDNASDDADELQVLCDSAGVRLIRNSVNVGFGIACNQGAAASGTEFLMFLNPDALLMPGTLDCLVGAAERYPQASAMNPRLVKEDGTPSFKRSSHLTRRSENMPSGWPGADCEVSVLSGAALFVRRRDFDAVKGFDPEIFLYHEDDDLSLRLRAERGPVMFIRDAEVKHLGGLSSVRNPEIAALKAWHMGRSRVYATRKHGVRFGLSLALMHAVLQFLSPATLFSRRKRSKHIGFLKGVLASFPEDRQN